MLQYIPGLPAEQSIAYDILIDFNRTRQTGRAFRPISIPIRNSR
jgi:hypothetical protein